MNGINEPKEPRKTIEPDKWETFLREFADRNNNRRARFDVFLADGTIEEEGIEAHLEDVRLETRGNANDIVIVRIERGDKTAHKKHDTITNVRGIGVQLDTDGSEDALEITDDQNALISLRLESKVDGNS
jgi:hypothetical protein